MKSISRRDFHQELRRRAGGGWRSVNFAAQRLGPSSGRERQGSGGDRGSSEEGHRAYQGVWRDFPASRSRRCAIATPSSWTWRSRTSGTRNQTVAAYVDFRRVLDDRNIDAVILSVPDHWHALMTVWACQAGKHVYVEKPATYSIWEGRQMVEAARKYDRVVGVGSQERSDIGLLAFAAHLKEGQSGQGPLRPGHLLRPAREHREGQRPAAYSGNL